MTNRRPCLHSTIIIFTRMETTFEKVLDILIDTKTNWKAEKQELFSSDGKSSQHYGMFRGDTGHCMGVVKEGYTPMQNSRLVELLVDATSELDLQVTNGGTMKQGARVFYQMQLPDEYVGKSSIQRHITALNSHDGGMSIGFGSSNTVVVCQNTFYRAYKDLSKVKHTESSDIRVQDIVADIKRTIKKDILLIEDFKRMADLEMQDEVVERVIRKMFGIDPSKQQSEVSSRKFNQVQTFAGNIKTEIELEGKTVWALFNAVTRYTNHEIAPKEIDKRAEHLMTGRGQELSNLAFDDIMAWVDKKTALMITV